MTSGSSDEIIVTYPVYLVVEGPDSIYDILMGNYVGPMGCTCVLILLLCGMYLAIRKTLHWQIPAAVIAVITLFALVMPRVNSSPLSSVTLELISGSMLFCLIFIASIDSGELHTGLGRWIYGLILGILIVLFRALSRIEMVTPFAIIIMNAIDHRCDAYGEYLIVSLKKCGSGLKRSVLFVLHGIGKIGAKIWEWISLLLQRMVDGPKK